MTLTTLYLIIGIDMVLLFLFFLFMTFYVKEKVNRYMELQWKQADGVSDHVSMAYPQGIRHKMKVATVPPSEAAGTAKEVKRLKDKGFSKEQMAGQLGISTGEVDILLALSDMQRVA